jgi:TaqI-like C-terminal specificity domain/N-6 DNA Methylase
VDTAFLAEIEGWRKEIAQNLAIRNPKLTQRELNFAVQRIIDRIIFLRICEDRGIEDYGRLRALVNADRIYPRLTKLFEDADARYNSGLFHFKKESERHEDPDELTLALDLDDKLLREILRGLYYPECPYQFSVFSADILGQVYEQFLGTVIRLTDGHHAVPELKPEVRKAGGVYYTPTYIVDYIVRQTVGKLVEGKTPKQVEKISILDPACGSGSFLIGAYQFLLDWHLQFYLANNPVKWAKGGKPALVQSGKGWRLTIAERKRILLANIYGVDIDTQAVEVTKLSLLLKVLEGETGQTLQTIFRLFQERALPDLGDNIKCGNSLIGPDFYQQGELPLLTDDEKYRINVFDWQKEFPQIFRRRTAGGELRDAPPPLDYTMPGVPLHGSYSIKKMKEKDLPHVPVEPEWEGGFDAVIGNPPWGAQLSEPELEYLRQKNRDIIVRMIDSFMYFVHQGSQKLNSTGMFGMILPDVILYQTDNQKLREFVLSHFRIQHILNMGDVFDKVTRPACILIIECGPSAKQMIDAVDLSEVSKTDKPTEIQNRSRCVRLAQRKICEVPGALFVTSNLDHYVIWTKVQKVPNEKLENLVDEHGIQRGVSPDLKEAFLIDSKTAKKLRLEPHKLRKVLTGGKQVKRYFIERPDLLLIYTNRDDDFRELPNIRGYIDQFKERITCKEVKQHKHPLYALHRARDERIFLKKRKLLGVITEDEIVLAEDNMQTFATDGLYLFGIRESIDDKYVMGILNSRFFVFIYRLLALESGRVLAQVKPTVLAQLPIRTINFADKSDKAAHDRMVKLVEQMLELHPKLAGARTPQEKTALERQIAATDTQIDALVYELYALTPAEIKIVEGLQGCHYGK